MTPYHTTHVKALASTSDEEAGARDDTVLLSSKRSKRRNWMEVAVEWSIDKEKEVEEGVVVGVEIDENSVAGRRHCLLYPHVPRNFSLSRCLSSCSPRTHTCGELGLTHVGSRVVLNGWIQAVRKLSPELVFVPIRDSYGTTQLIYRNGTNDSSISLKKTIDTLSNESVVCVEGMVVARSDDMVDKQTSTGEIEVEMEKLCVLNEAKNLPFYPSEKKLLKEDIRLRNRHIDLRQPVLQQNLRKRSHAGWIIRDFLIQKGFTEVETPILFKHTSEGAREFIVPTQNVGMFYALTQSPQQYKQLLMASGIDRYFQIAKCFRDEGLRADRQPEFTQIDLELSFASANDIKKLVEELIGRIWKQLLHADVDISEGFKTISYKDAMTRYGTDKPDTRYGMKISDITSYFPDAPWNSSNTIECLVIKRGSSFTGGEIKSLQAVAESQSDAGKNENNMVSIKEQQTNYLDFIKVNSDNITSWMAKTYVGKKISNAEEIARRMLGDEDIEAGDLIVLGMRDRFISGGWTPMGRVRSHASSLLQKKGLLSIPQSQYDFLWVDSFPLFTREKESNALRSTHHPFTAPCPKDLELLNSDPEKVHGQHYDLVINGVEVGGGSIRIHSPELQTMVLEKILNLNVEERNAFKHLIDALGHGCPPHGGIALGFDRLMAIICGSSSIRDVIAFPKSSSGSDLLVSSPSTISKSYLAEYGLGLASDDN
ncbi:3845_t:CDS:10 [Paraglomus occultum]|uniref:3845_t:CDS:1 n=1 Tax=Paraglomus occultum TaxID=144539 RepID=A0A9N8Z6X4_9GLOM|nr:3845_t:CDS:10 [Paraglomus occultum]